MNDLPPPADADDGPSSQDRRPDTRDPHRSREHALKILFDADVRGQAPLDALRRIVADPDAVGLLDDLDVSVAKDDGRRRRQARDEADSVAAGRRRPRRLDGYARRLVEGVHDHVRDLDTVIEQHARRWTVKRMPIIDRNLLRLGAYELLYEDTAPAVVIDEAVELAKALSTDKSARFVNGVLEAIRRNRDAGDNGAA